MTGLEHPDGQGLGLGARLALGVALVVGVVLRTLPAPYGLPFIFHPDETFLLTELGKFLGGLSQGSVPFGISTFHYLLAAPYAAYFGLGAIMGHIHSTGDIQNAFLLDAPILHLIGRIVSALLSVGTILLTFFVGRRAFSARVGVIAALLNAVSLPEIAGAHWLKQNAVVTLMMLAATLAILNASRRNWSALRPWVLGGVLGLALATRIDLAICIIVFLFAIFLEADGTVARVGLRRLTARPTLMVLAVAVVAYLLVTFELAVMVLRQVSPHPAGFVTRGTGASLIEFLAAGDLLTTIRHNVGFYFSRAFVGTSGMVLSVAIVAGIARAVWSRRREDWLLLSLVGLTLAQLLAFNVYGVHYFARFLPILLILGASAIVAVSELAPVRHRAWLLAGLVAVVVAQPAYYSIRYVRYLTGNVDTRVRAREWIYGNIPFGTPMAAQKFDELPRYLPPLNESLEFAQEKLRQIRADSRRSGLALQARIQSYPADTFPITNLSLTHQWDSTNVVLENQYDWTALRASGVQYVVMSSLGSPLMDEEADTVGLLISPHVLDKGAFRRYDLFVKQLPEQTTLVAEFAPKDRVVARQTDSPVDPIIRIYRVR